MDYKELFKLIENFTAEDFKTIRDTIQEIMDKNPKVSLQQAEAQIESFKKNKQNDNII